MSRPEIVFATATYKTAGGRTRSADTRAARALRGLQILDQMTGRGVKRPWLERTVLLSTMDVLGAQLFLRCTGTPDGQGEYQHDGGTCPIHEWLVPADHDVDIPGDVDPAALVRGIR